MSKRLERFWARRVAQGSGDVRVWPPHGAELVVRADALPTVLAEWTYVEDGVPRLPDHTVVFDELMCLVTDGTNVGVCGWQRGHGCGEAWASWGAYGDIPPEKIIAWIAYPKAAAVRTKAQDVVELGNYRECEQSKAERVAAPTFGEAVAERYMNKVQQL